VGISRFPSIKNVATGWTSQRGLARDADARHQSSLVEHDLQKIRNYAHRLADFWPPFKCLWSTRHGGCAKALILHLALLWGHTFVKHDVERFLNSRISNALIDPRPDARSPILTMGHAPWRVWRCLVKTCTKNANPAIFQELHVTTGCKQFSQRSCCHGCVCRGWHFISRSSMRFERSKVMTWSTTQITPP
jgi:hypothetical protein